MLVTDIFFHQVSILDTQGLNPQQAATVFSVTAIAMVSFMPMFGRLLDRHRTQNLFSATMVLMAASLALMSQVQGMASALAFGALFGLTSAAQHTHMSYV